MYSRVMYKVTYRAAGKAYAEYGFASWDAAQACARAMRETGEYTHVRVGRDS